MRNFKASIFIVILLIPFCGFTRTFQSVGDGSWSNNLIWNEYTGSWGSTTNIPAYGDIVRIHHNVTLDISLLTGVDRGFLILRVDSTGNLSGISATLTVGNGDYVSCPGSMTLGGLTLKAGGIFLVKGTGSVTISSGVADDASNSMVIDGSLVASSLSVSGKISGTGSVDASSFSGIGTVFGSVQPSGALHADGFIWIAPSDGSWFNNSHWIRYTPGGSASDMIPNDTIRAIAPTTTTGKIIIDDPAKVATAHSLIIRPGQNITIQPNCELIVSNDITNNAGTDGLVINSDATGSGSVILPLNEVTSYKPDATVKIYVTGSTDLSAMKYHFVSVPVEQSANPTSNIFLGSYLFDFNEGTNSWENLGSSTTIPLDVTRGYMTYYPDGASTTYSISGKLNSGKFYPSITNNGSGYNLVPNPYSSAIDWESSGGWKRINIAPTCYIWPAGKASVSSNYNTWNYVTHIGTPAIGQTNPGRKEIAMGQSFIVQVSEPSPDFSMTNAVCTNVNPPFLKNTPAIPNLLRIKCVAELNNAFDEVAVNFREGATPSFDQLFDGNKFLGGAEAPQLSTTASDNSELCVNCLPFNSSGAIVPVHFSFYTNSQVDFTASGMQSFAAGVSILLEDHSLNKVTNLKQDSVYQFTYHTADPIDRFRLRFSGSIGISEAQNSSDGKAFFSNHNLYLDLPSMQGTAADIRVYSVLGQVVSSERVMINGVARIDAPANAGVYIVEAVSADHRFVSKIVCK
jgi:hypothetical protein